MKCSFGQRVRLLLLHTIEVANCLDVMLRSVRNRHFLKIVIELLGEEAVAILAIPSFLACLFLVHLHKCTIKKALLFDAVFLKPIRILEDIEISE